MQFPSTELKKKDVLLQTYDIIESDNGSTINMQFSGDWVVNLPNINNVEANFDIKIAYKQENSVVSDVVAYYNDSIDGNGHKKIYGQGFINIRKVETEVGLFEWFVVNQSDYNTVKMQGKTRRLDFVNQSTVQLQHDLGFIPIVQVWTEDNEGGYVEVNVDIDHDWSTMNSFQVEFGTQETGKIIY